MVSPNVSDRLKLVNGFYKYLWYIGLLVTGCLFASITIFILLWMPFFVLIFIIACVFIFSTCLFLAFVLKEKKEKFFNVARVALFPIIIFLISSFLLGFLCSAIDYGLELQMPSSKIRFPLGNLEGIAVDNQGRIYCGSSFYSRLQAFDKNGDFLRGWFAPLSKGGEHINVEDNNICVAMSTKCWIYDPNGKLLNSKEYSFFDFEAKYGLHRDMSAKDIHGNFYNIERGFLSPKITKTGVDGNTIVLISDPLKYWIIRIPFPGIVFIVFLLIGNLVISGTKKTSSK